MSTDYEESGITFQFDNALLFRPEVDPALAKLHGVKKCDFIFEHANQYLHFVEVQNSAPSPVGDQDKLRRELGQCFDKFLHSLLFTFSHICKRSTHSTFPRKLDTASHAILPIRFILFLPEFDKVGCLNMQDKLRQQVASIQRAFGKIEAFVVNKDNAHKKGIFVTSPPAH